MPEIAGTLHRRNATDSSRRVAVYVARRALRRRTELPYRDRFSYGDFKWRSVTSRRRRPRRPTACSLSEVLRLHRSVRRLREQNDELLEQQSLLEDSRDDYAELYDSAPHPLLTLGESGTVRSANFAAAELLECERSLLLGRVLLEFLGEQDRPRLSACSSAGRGLKDCRVHLVLPDETSVLVHVSRRFSKRRSGVLNVTLVDFAARGRFGRARAGAEAHERVAASFWSKMTSKGLKQCRWRSSVMVIGWFAPTPSNPR